MTDLVRQYHDIETTDAGTYREMVVVEDVSYHLSLLDVGMSLNPMRFYTMLCDWLEGSGMTIDRAWSVQHLKAMIDTPRLKLVSAVMEHRIRQMGLDPDSNLDDLDPVAFFDALPPSLPEPRVQLTTTTEN